LSAGSNGVGREVVEDKSRVSGVCENVRRAPPDSFAGDEETRHGALKLYNALRILKNTERRLDYTRGV
jgi:hypothetical protein